MNDVEAVAMNAATATPGRPIRRNRATVPRGPSRTSMNPTRKSPAQIDRQKTIVQLSPTAMNRAMAPPKLQIRAEQKTRDIPRSRSAAAARGRARVDVIAASGAGGPGAGRTSPDRIRAAVRRPATLLRQGRPGEMDERNGIGPAVGLEVRHLAAGHPLGTRWPPR